MLLGTAAYMSPEQARGARVDRRADVWRRRLSLRGADWDARVPWRRHLDGARRDLTREPDWERLPTDLPQSIGALLRRCLQKDTRQRLQDVGDARWLLAEARESAIARATPAIGSRGGRTKVAAALPVVAAVAGVAGWVTSRAVAPRAKAAETGSSVVRFEVVPPILIQSDALSFREFAVHPQGTAFAFAGEDGIRLHDLARGDSRPIPGALGSEPFFSADGEWLGFFSAYFENTVFKVPAAGGLRQRICTLDSGEWPAGFAWRGDWIVFSIHLSRARGLWKVRASGGVRERLGADPRLGTGMHPSFLPDRDAVLFNSRDDEESLTQWLRVVDLSTGAVTDLGVEGRTPQYLSSGHLVWARDDGLWAARFDPDRLRILGDARPVMETPSASPMAASFSISPDGTLVTLEPTWYDLVETGLDGTRRKLAEAPTWSTWRAIPPTAPSWPTRAAATATARSGSMSSPPAARASSEGLHSKRGRCGQREARSPSTISRRRVAGSCSQPSIGTPKRR